MSNQDHIDFPVVQKPQAIAGFMRFSLVLESSNFFPPLTGKSYEERTALIFDRERLERRFDLFENLCLPSLTGQTDQNFNLLIATSRDLPDWAHQRLDRLVREIPNVFVHAFRPQANIRRIYKRSAFELLDAKAAITATFRIDDDDAIASDYIARLREYMVKDNIGKIVTFSNGYQLVLSENQLQMWTDTRHSGSVGLAMVHAGGVSSIPLTNTIHCLGGHRKVGEFAPLIVDERPDMYVQTANGVNVSGRRGGESSEALSAEDIEARLSENFPYLNAARLNKLHEICSD